MQRFGGYLRVGRPNELWQRELRNTRGNRRAIEIINDLSGTPRLHRRRDRIPAYVLPPHFILDQVPFELTERAMNALINA